MSAWTFEPGGRIETIGVARGSDEFWHVAVPEASAAVTPRPVRSRFEHLEVGGVVRVDSDRVSGSSHSVSDREHEQTTAESEENRGRLGDELSRKAGGEVHGDDVRL